MAQSITTKKTKGVASTNIKNSGYSEAGASYKKKSMKGFKAQSLSPARDIDDNNYTLRQRSRMLYMAAPIAASAVKTNRTNVVGNGLKLKCTIDRNRLGMTQEAAEAWQKKTEAEFEMWASKKNACDATGINDFYGIQQLCLVSSLLSGDSFVLLKHYERTKLMPYSLRLHVIEADRIRTPTDKAVTYPSYTTGKTEDGNYIYDGVETDKNGMVQAYHVANTYPYDFTGGGTKFTRVKAYGDNTELPNILHIMESERPDQYRGVPYLAQVIEPLLQLRRYTESEIMAALIQSFYTAFITTQDDPNSIPFNEVSDEVSEDENEYELAAGTINILKPGEGVTFSSPTHPETGFDAFVRSMCSQVGGSLEIPVDLLLKQFNSSYSASRAALLEAWKAFRMRREWLTNDLCRPTYEVWLTEAIALGRISAPGFLTDPIIRRAYLASDWIGPSQGQLDPVKEVNAAILAIEAGLSTRSAESIKLNGTLFANNVEALAAENTKLKAANGEVTEKPAEKLQNAINNMVQAALQKEWINDADDEK